MNRRRVELLDTSILVEILGVPGESDERDTILDQLDAKAKSGTKLLVSVTGLVEAGDHVGNIDDGNLRRDCAIRFENMITATVSAAVPWTFEPLEWDEPLIRSLLEPRGVLISSVAKSLADKFLQVGDLLIVEEYDRLRSNLDRSVVDVDVWTKDANLRSVVDYLRSGH